MIITILLILVIVALAVALLISRRAKTNLQDEIVSITDKNNLDFRRGFDAGWDAGIREGRRSMDLEWLVKTKQAS